MKSSILYVETLTGPPISIQDTQYRLRSQFIRLKFPGINGGLIWNRPLAVVLRAAHGQEKIVPIADVTQIAMFALAGLCIGMFVLMLLRRKKSQS